jgi:hypothetical protein
MDAGRPPAPPSTLRVGWASSDLIPPGPAPMRGGVTAAGVLDPIRAVALAIDAEAAGGVVLVGCDLLAVPDGLRGRGDLVGTVRGLVAERLGPDGPERVVLSATHTHASLTGDLRGEVFEHVADRIADAAARAWRDRDVGAVSYGLGHAVAGHHRIVSYRDGTARMVGSLQRGSLADSDATHIQGYEDHAVHLMYVWDDDRRLTGVVINVACTAQVQRGDHLTADYVHELRALLNERLGDIDVLVQISAAGDFGTHVMVETRAEDRMARLMFPSLDDRTSLRRAQLARRLADAVTDVLPWMTAVAESAPVFAFGSARVPLPGGFPEPDGTTMVVEIDAVRIGDMAIVTNPFELYVDYGARIKARSPAVQTFVVQLAGSGSYLPTQRAVREGSYGAIERSCVVGPSAGDALVDASLDLLHELWHEPTPAEPG